MQLAQYENARRRGAATLSAAAVCRSVLTGGGGAGKK